MINPTGLETRPTPLPHERILLNGGGLGWGRIYLPSQVSQMPPVIRQLSIVSDSAVQWTAFERWEVFPPVQSGGRRNRVSRGGLSGLGKVRSIVLEEDSQMCMRRGEAQPGWKLGSGCYS
jgi:hypothetical protein